jgi:tRNA A37 threonylcarbamoyltransferase TsaD
MRAFATGPRVALAADARSDAHHRFATDVAAAAAPRRHVVGARRDAHARSPGVRARWALPRGFASGPPGVASAPSVVARASASGDPDRGPGFGFGSRALDASRLDARGRVPVGARTVILGIETSCDDTGAAVITGDGRVLGEAIASQGEIHAKWGGVVPNLAREAHENAIDDVVARALAAADVRPENLSAVAVTVGPGLSMCLRVGVVKAQNMCVEHSLPIVPVHHMEAHALVARVGEGGKKREGVEKGETSETSDETSDVYETSSARASFPFLALLVSGGHNQLILATAIGEYRVLGGALDDALGEAYDKTARLLGLDVGGGGGPALEALAKKGDPKKYKFPVPLRKRKDCDFSYAGLKTAVRLAVERDLGKPSESDAFSNVQGLEGDDDGVRINRNAEMEAFGEEETARRDAIRADIAASFQFAAVKHLEERTRRAIAWARESLSLEPQNEDAEKRDLSCVVVAGGVAANATVRATLGSVAEEAGLPLVLPPPRWCTDNGVMVAWAGVERFRLGLAEEAPSAEQLEPKNVSDGKKDEDASRPARREVPLLPRWPLGTRDARATGEVKSSKTARIAPPLRGAPLR